MDNSLLIIVISILAVGLIAIIVPMVISFLNAKQVSTEDMLNNIDDLASIVKTINNSMNKYVQSRKALDLTISSAEQAVKYAEQLYISGQISEGDRKEKAVQFVRTVLYNTNIDITPERENLINSSIEAAVFLLPRTTKH